MKNQRITNLKKNSALISSLLIAPSTFAKRPIEAIDTMSGTGGPSDGSLFIFLGLIAAVMFIFKLIFPKDQDWLWGLWVAPVIAGLLTHLFL